MKTLKELKSDMDATYVAYYDADTIAEEAADASYTADVACDAARDAFNTARKAYYKKLNETADDR